MDYVKVYISENDDNFNNNFSICFKIDDEVEPIVITKYQMKL